MPGVPFFVIFCMFYLVGYYPQLTLTVANLLRGGISVRYSFSIKSQYSVTFLSLSWITGGHISHTPIEGLLPPIGTESHGTAILAPK